MNGFIVNWLPQIFLIPDVLQNQDHFQYLQSVQILYSYSLMLWHSKLNRHKSISLYFSDNSQHLRWAFRLNNLDWDFILFQNETLVNPNPDQRMSFWHFVLIQSHLRRFRVNVINTAVSRRKNSLKALKLNPEYLWFRSVVTSNKIDFTADSIFSQFDIINIKTHAHWNEKTWLLHLSFTSFYYIY